jgi:molybdopterin-containing oxidoreductase family membrane subunit
VAKYYFATIEGKSPKYIAGVLITGALMLGWLIASYIRVVKGYYLTGLSHSVAWGGAKVIFVLFVGLSAGSLMISGLAAIFNQKEYKVLARVAAFNAALFMVGALGILISDWGRPDRILLPFYMINPRSLLSLNAFIYSTYITICILYLWAQFKENEKVARVLGVAAVITAIFVHSGTGFIFGIINGRDMFFSSITPLAFVVAALSSGTSLAILMLYYSFKWTKRQIDPRFFHQLSKILVALIIFVFYLVTIEHLTHLYDPEFQEGEKFVMFSGNFFSWVFWGQLYLLGLLVPIYLLLNPKTGNKIKWVLVASALHVFGVLGERILFILPGQVLPVPILPGYELTSPFQDGVHVAYIPHVIEWFQFIGIFGFIVFVYMLGLKILPLLPVEGVYVKEAHAEAAEAVEAKDDSGDVAAEGMPAEA